MRYVEIGWGVLAAIQNAVDNVVNVGEVSLQVSVIKDLDWQPVHDVVSEAEVGHVGSARRSVNGKESKSRHWNAVKLRIAVCHDFIRLFGCCVEADRVIRWVGLTKH